MRRLDALSTILIALAAANASAATYKVIVNQNVNVQKLSRHAVSDIFLKKTASWQGGEAVVAVDNAAAPLRQEFSHGVHGKAEAAVKSYWNQQIFAGRSLPPLEKASDAEVIAFVRATHGAIGYVSNAADTTSVKVLTVE